MTACSDVYWRHRRTGEHGEFRGARDLLLAMRLDHDAACTTFRWPRPRHFNWALEWFDVIADGNDSPALHVLHDAGPGEVVSYARMSAESDRTAVWLGAQGVRRGDRVLVLLGAQRELWECFLACLKIGAVLVPSSVTITGPEIKERVRRGRIQHIICRDDVTSRIDVDVPGVRVAVPGDVPGWSPYRLRAASAAEYLPDGPTLASDIAFCYFTSGTTSSPKLVAHTQASYPVGHLSSLFWNGIQPGDRHLNISTPGWAKHAWSSLFVPWNAEAVIVVPPEPMNPAALPALLRDHRITSVCAPPSTWQRLRPHLHEVRPALREATSAGEPLPEQIVAEVSATWGVTVRDGYGQSEATALIGTSPGLPRVPGWLGKPLPGYQITLRDARGRLAGQQGELCVERDDDGMWPAGLMPGYLDEHGDLHPPATEGFYRTGDLGERDEAGHFRVLGRTDDIFKSFDRRISPYELEAVIKSHVAVADAAVIPRAHPDGGAVPHAVVVLLPGQGGGPVIAATILEHWPPSWRRSCGPGRSRSPGTCHAPATARSGARHCSPIRCRLTGWTRSWRRETLHYYTKSDNYPAS
jgi:acetyl-CoA synthetase